MMLFRFSKKKSIVVLCLFLLLSICFTTFFLVQSRYFHAPTPNVFVNYASSLRTLDSNAIGMDASGYGAPQVLANDALEQQRLKVLGVKYMRMDLKFSVTGDPTSKIVCAGDGCDTRWTGDQWVQAIKAIGATPVVIVHYDVVDAVNMVKHFNRDTANSVQFWLIGNEPDLNGIDVQNYSQTFNQEYAAMKAVDPTIQIGGGTTAWYDNDFLRAFLQQCGNNVDFVDFHLYAQPGTVTGDYKALFQVASSYTTDIEKLRALIQSIVPVRAAHIRIEVGEWELNFQGSAQDNTNFHALWAASAMGHILSAGGWSLFYADKDNAFYSSQHTFLDAHHHSISVNVDDPNPAYHGIGMFTGEGLFQHFGNILVQATTTLPDVEVYASDNPKDIVLINKNPSKAQTVVVSLQGMTSATTVSGWRKDESVAFSSPPIPLQPIPVQNAVFTYQMPPFSVTTFAL